MRTEKSKKKTKQAIVEAALLLFQTKGYDGTSIRDIAQKADINSANIAYYFKNKNGLLEHCFVDYFERYTAVIENEVRSMDSSRADRCLMAIISNVVQFQGDNFLATRFVTREMSRDTLLNREVLSTYMAKERYYLQYVIEQGIKADVFRDVSIPPFILALKGLLTAPFTHAGYSKQLLHILPREQYYIEQYKAQCIDFLQYSLFSRKIEVTS
ncbi:MAG: forespore capture DNA-binding protein RefZ [Bacillus sp. (in: firmicutes)]